MVWICQNLRIRSSRKLACYLLLIHGAALSSLMMTALPWSFRGAVAGLILCSLVQGFRRYVLLLARGSVRALSWADDGTWTLIFADGRSGTGRLKPAAFVHRHLLVLGFYCQGHSVTVVLADDNTQADVLRRLRVRLRFSSGGLSARARVGRQKAMDDGRTD